MTLVWSTWGNILISESFLLLISLFILLVFISAFFSSSETGMMSINRYRLRHRARKGHKASVRVQDMLKRPDRLLGVILIGNTFANVLASAVATVLSVRLFGEFGVFLATIAVTLILLVFSEITPKTFAAIKPDWISYHFSLPLKWLAKLLYPVVWLSTTVSNGILWCFQVNVKKASTVEHLSIDELRTVLSDAAGKVSSHYKQMLVSILDLADATVEDVMVPLHDIKGIDMNESWENILERLSSTQHTWLPVYQGSLESIKGMLHVRSALNKFAQNKMNKTVLLDAAEEVYFIPEGAQLDVQLFNFQRERRRIAMVLDEYGEIQGLVTMEDILEEIVGEFTTDWSAAEHGVRQSADGAYLIEGRLNIRDLNRLLSLELPMSGPRTLSGVIVEHLEMLPESQVCLRIAGYPIEVVKIKGNKIAEAKIIPKLRSK